MNTSDIVNENQDAHQNLSFTKHGRSAQNLAIGSIRF